MRCPPHSVMYAAAFCELIPMILHVILGRPVTSRSPASCSRRVCAPHRTRCTRRLIVNTHSCWGIARRRGSSPLWGCLLSSQLECAIARSLVAELTCTLLTLRSVRSVPLAPCLGEHRGSWPAWRRHQLNSTQPEYTTPVTQNNEQQIWKTES